MSTTTPLMSLVLPTPGPLGDIGPDWANLLNSAITLIDSHDHTTGKGSMIPSSSININADLDMKSYNSKNVRSIKLNNNGAVLSLATDLGCIYEVAGNFYFNNAAGTPVQITSGSGLNLTSLGTIGGDYSTSTASLSYSSAAKDFAFTWTSGITASLTCGAVKIYEQVAGGKYVKLQVPTGLGANYTLTMMGALPASTLPLSIDASGNLSNAQITTAQITDANVTTAKIADANVTRAKVETLLQYAFCPIGSVQMFAGASAPTGYLLCDGSAISRSTYADLFTAISTIWGTGDGSTTFNIPDMRGIFPKGAGTTTRAAGADALSAQYTSTLGAYYQDHFQGHYHTMSPSDTTGGSGTGGTYSRWAFGTGSANSDIGPKDPKADASHGTPRTGTTTEPQAVGINYIIKY